MNQRRPRQHDKAHLQFIRSLPCLVCMNNIETQAAHIRFSLAGVYKVNAGVGAKADDRWTVPLCGRDHNEQHKMGNEQRYWQSVGIDPIEIAKHLYAVSGDHEAGCKIIAKAQPVNILAAG
jgi:hypothetical protein